MSRALSAPLAKNVGESARTTPLKLPVLPVDSAGKATVSAGDVPVASTSV